MKKRERVIEDTGKKRKANEKEGKKNKKRHTSPRREDRCT